MNNLPPPPAPRPNGAGELLGSAVGTAEPSPARPAGGRGSGLGLGGWEIKKSFLIFRSLEKLKITF